jgi:hypothetical protein
VCCQEAQENDTEDSEMVQQQVMAVLGEGNTCFYHLIYELVLSDSLAATKR